ncbi:hypothetical protein CAPTEDRAFT_206066 [Capitella teleta]|uniref:Acidic fibroblast growth factor intracellular-binding protein n=1 Tax=Capitella teleta TaxID=283909 RepID=R7UQS2_CAPTE|nr:hypothetical protein CAPTEDRAFT_206066 [Capitella teleta]|eukprot:ELU08879.1 hypothetical protein CAPTEDRAFT_206066 [Capitella teleta]
MANVDIFVGNETLIDPDVYQLWLDGYTAQETAQILQKRGILQQYGATFDMLLSDTLDHYRNFFVLERYLKNPVLVGDQLLMQISPQTQAMLIEKYYEFDSSVVRELLGKKLTTRQRNALDDVSDKTRVPLRSCRRQFDNVKQVFKTVEEMLGSLVDNIKTHFLLSDHLAKQYAAIVFITNNRFETGKKRLGYLTFPDFVHCANEMITNWSYSSKDCKHHDDMDQDLDRDFLIDLRDLKILSEKEHLDEHRVAVLKAIHGKLSTSAAVELDHNFKNISKTLINVASGLNHSRELRDLFEDFVDKFIDPCKQAKWTQNDVKIFLQAYAEVAQQMHVVRSNSQLLKVWERYTGTISSCLIQMYHP